MQVRVPVLLAVASTTLGASLMACFDLFHSTGDVLTACQLDASAPGCAKEASVEAGVDAGTDFCSWSDPQPLQNAQHACAWLGACESPLGRNAFGSCMFQALLAYDCTANPSHPVKGKTHALWDCLWQVESCVDVNACVFPQGSQQCQGGPVVTCASQGGVNADTRAECLADGGGPYGENCALWGQTCGGDLGGVGTCAGSEGEAGIACATQGCSGTSLHWCGDGLDVGIDCADNGAQACGVFPSVTDAGWAACLPSGDAGTCSPTGSVQCTSGLATSCPAGIPESLNCRTLLNDVNACTPGELSPPFDWTSPCAVATDASPCTDSCNGSTLTGCTRGAAFSVDCKSVGSLGACRMVATNEGNALNAACTPP
jgi:hypothetical protein